MTKSVDKKEQPRASNQQDTAASHENHLGNGDMAQVLMTDYMQKMMSALPHTIYWINARDYTVQLAKIPGEQVEMPAGKKCYELVFGRDRPCAAPECPCVLQAAVETKKMVVREHRHVDADGKIRFYEVYAFPLLDEDGEVSQLIGYPMDVTSRREEEKRSERDRSRYQKIFDAATDGIVIIDSSDTILDANPCACRMFGYALDEIKKIQGKQLAPAEYLPVVRKALEELLEEGEFFVEIEGVRKDGSRFDLEMKGTLFEEAQIPRMLGHLRDISTRKQAERAAMLNRQQYEDVFNAATDGLAVVNFGDKVEEVNPQLCAMFGYSREELLHLYGADLVTPSAREDFAGIRTSVQESGQFRVETTGVRKDGTAFDMEVMGTRFKGQGGNQVLGIFRDISERKEHERMLESRGQELLVQTQNLEDANAALKVLLQRREEDRKEFDERLMTNFKELVMPHLERLKETSLTARQQSALEMLEANLGNIVNPFLQNLKAKFHNLTPAEIRVIDLIKEGKRTKEIADILGLSKRTIDFYRYNIRKKLDIDDKTSLSTYLLTLV